MNRSTHGADSPFLCSQHLIGNAAHDYERNSDALWQTLLRKAEYSEEDCDALMEQIEGVLIELNKLQRLSQVVEAAEGDLASAEQRISQLSPEVSR